MTLLWGWHSASLVLRMPLREISGRQVNASKKGGLTRPARRINYLSDFFFAVFFFAVFFFAGFFLFGFFTESSALLSERAIGMGSFLPFMVEKLEKICRGAFQPKSATTSSPLLAPYDCRKELKCQLQKPAGDVKLRRLKNAGGAGFLFKIKALED